MAAKYGHLINRWTVAAVAALAVMAALIATTLTAWAQDQPPASDDPVKFNYNENGIGPVHRYGATDPEGKKIFWTLGGPDAADFTIVRGDLRFRSPPDYENPTDRDEDTATDGYQRAMDNLYRVTVRFGAGGEDGDPDPSDDYDGDDLHSVDVTVTVINVNEPGMVLISPLQPQVGTDLTATVTDRDRVAATGTWQWASSHSKTGPFVNIQNLSNNDTYQPVLEDLGKYLRVAVEYRDNVSQSAIREEMAVSKYQVRRDVVTTTDPPKFPDQRTLGLAADTPNDTPLYARGTTERFIPEDSPAGTDVGAPVTAFDDARSIDILTYSLRDTTAGSGHAADFDIDPATGQITVSASADLNADVGATDLLGGATGPYLVTVQAVDGDGHRMDIAVNIRVVGVNEPPMIDRVYHTDRIPTDSGYTGGHRAPTEISHYESDRTDRSPTTLDANLDTGSAIEPAVYRATDEDSEDLDASLTWWREGPDGAMFKITPPETPDGTATLAFSIVPDFENPLDENKDNVYEVTIVVKDSVKNRDELPVTVKVINSTEDNESGKVTLSNRVPEIATRLTATLEDTDKPVKEENWQWYRSVATDTVYPTVCPDMATTARFFIDGTDGGPGGGAAWEKIDGATSPNYTPHYDDRVGGTVEYQAANGNPMVPNAPPQSPTMHREAWTGGDYDVTVIKTPKSGGGYTITRSDWENPRCLRAAVTYRDTIGGELGKDRTHADADDLSTDDVDETLEGAFAQSEYPVKPIDEENDAPVFTDNGNAVNAATDQGTPVSQYRAERRENATTNATFDPAADPPETPTLRIIEAKPASDPMKGEDDDTEATPAGRGADVLTYTLGGPDEGSFELYGTVGNPGTDLNPDGTLIITDDLDYEDEDKRTYTVTITATDPSGDQDSVTVIVDITNHNEPPEKLEGKGQVPYAENGMGVVATYMAKDPEGSGIIYSLVTAIEDDIVATDLADHGKFEINPLHGTLSFMSPPNYEKPGDAGITADNKYQVVVKATVADQLPGPADHDPPFPHAVTKKVTVMVTNVNEPPVFSETTDTLAISENPDDPEQGPLLNRGVGKPAANLPASPHLDVGVPVVAADDDSTSNFALGGYGDTTRDRIDGLTYTLSGSGAGTMFDIVHATGQILTIDKLDYEGRNSYVVTVTATDPWDASDSIDVTINVTDVDEVPVTPNLVVSGPNSHTYQENGTVAVGEYMAVGTGADMVRWIPIEGADSDYFELEGSGSSVMLKFRDPPNYEMPRGMAMSGDNTNTYMVTVKILHTPSGDTAEQDVTIRVIDAAELGMLDGDETVTYAENGTSAVDTYRVDGPMADMAMWTLEGDDMDQFTLDTETGGSVMLMFVDSPNYEMPRGMAMSTDNANIYMVTVKAMVGGEMEMRDVTISVTDVDDPGMVAISPQPQVLRTGTMLTATLSDDDGNVIDVTWRWSRSMTMDGIYTNIVGATSMTYTPVEADDGYYLMATATYTDAYGSGKAERATTNSAVTTVQDQMGMVRLSSMTPVVGAMLTATLSDPDDGVTGATWQWSKSMTMDGTFMDIAGATSMRYTPMAADENYYLMVKVMYTDGHGSGKMAMATSANAVSSGDPLVVEYDTNRNGTIEKSEVIAAINDYLFPPGGVEIITKAEVIRLINLYLFPDS